MGYSNVPPPRVTFWLFAIPAGIVLAAASGIIALALWLGRL